MDCGFDWVLLVSEVVLCCSGVGKLLSKWRSFSENRSLPVDNIDGDDEDEGDAGEDRGGICKRL